MNELTAEEAIVILEVAIRLGGKPQVRVLELVDYGQYPSRPGMYGFECWSLWDGYVLMSRADVVTMLDRVLAMLLALYKWKPGTNTPIIVVTINTIFQWISADVYRPWLKENGLKS